MDPVTMTAAATALSTYAPAISAAGTVVGAATQYASMNAQAKADQQRAQVESQWAERRSLEERAGAQRAAAEEHRKAVLAQSRLGAVAGASGSGSSDPTVMKLFEGIQGEGDYNAAAATASGAQKSAGIDYQSALDRWTADSNAGIKRYGATSTLIGGALKGASEFGSGFAKTRMSSKYGSGDVGVSGGGTGYGYR